MTGTFEYRSPIVDCWNCRMMRSMSSQFSSCASRSSSIRFAPAEKCGASLPTTTAAKLRSASRTPACSICSVSVPIAFIFEWNSIASTPSPMSTRLAPAFFLTMRDWSFAFLRICRSDARRLGSLLSRAQGRRRRAARADLTRDLEDAVDADRVGDLEWAEVPAKSPAHDTVHVVGRVGDAGAVCAA